MTLQKAAALNDPPDSGLRRNDIANTSSIK
jgi:hypothetical protein